MNRPALTCVRSLSMAGLALALAGCQAKAPVYTLYQSNVLDLTARLRFASFDIPDNAIGKKGDKPINQFNCEMTAGVLNAAVSQANNGVQTVRYWCEKGKYKEKAE